MKIHTSRRRAQVVADLIEADGNPAGRADQQGLAESSVSRPVRRRTQHYHNFWSVQTLFAICRCPTGCGIQGLSTIEEIEAAIQNLPKSQVDELAAQAFLKYRNAGGAKTSPLPDFYIGAHAAIENRTLISRDAARYRSYFPNVKLIAPA